MHRFTCEQHWGEDRTGEGRDLLLYYLGCDRPGSPKPHPQWKGGGGLEPSIGHLQDLLPDPSNSSERDRTRDRQLQERERQVHEQNGGYRSRETGTGAEWRGTGAERWGTGAERRGTGAERQVQAQNLREREVQEQNQDQKETSKRYKIRPRDMLPHEHTQG